MLLDFSFEKVKGLQNPWVVNRLPSGAWGEKKNRRAKRGLRATLASLGSLHTRHMLLLFPEKRISYLPAGNKDLLIFNAKTPEKEGKWTRLSEIGAQ